MATSSKVKFSLETLKAKALESIDLRIQHQLEEVESLGDEEGLARMVSEWREFQEERLHSLGRLLNDGKVTDRQLSEFRVEPIPEYDPRERRRAEVRLRELEALRSKVVAKSDSLVADENGNISLTKTQLAEFFGL